MQIFKVVILLFSFQLIANSDFDKAEKLFQQNKLAEAQLLFEKYLKENPTHTKTLEYLGDIAGANKNWDKAIVYYQKIKNQYPQNAVYQYKYGGVLGMKKTFAKLINLENKKIIIATVGLGDPKILENTNNIKAGMKKQISNELYEKAHIYHLRGGIDYSKLSLTHKTMMKLLYKKAKSLPDEKRNEETNTFIETYNEVVDFVDFNSLAPIIDYI